MRTQRKNLWALFDAQVGPEGGDEFIRSRRARGDTWRSIEADAEAAGARVSLEFLRQSAIERGIYTPHPRAVA